MSTYYTKEGITSTSSLELLGEVEARIGLEIGVSITFTGLHNFLHVGLSVEGGIYVQLTGIYHMETTISSTDGVTEAEYGAVYLEVGLYYSLNLNYKFFVFSGKNSLVGGKLPLLALGYNKMYYGYGTNKEETVVYNDRIALSDYGTLNVIYFNVKEMKSYNDKLYIEGVPDKYEIQMSVCDKDGNPSPYAYIRDGYIYVRDGGPCEVDLYLKYHVVGKDNGFDSPADLWKKNFNPDNCGYSLDDYILRIHVVNHKYGSSVVTQPPKCNETGLEVRFASCGCVDENGDLLQIPAVIPATGIHTYTAWEVVEKNTCLENGLDKRIATCNCKGEDGLPEILTYPGFKWEDKE
jgi:hypothetical protein